MAGYSETPLPKKLGIKENSRIALIAPPPNFQKELGPLPPGVQFISINAKTPSLVVLFAKSQAELKRTFPRLASRVPPDGILWIAWPKKASGVATDLSQGEVRRTGLDAGLVDVKICAVDETWSGLKFVVRLKDRANWGKSRKAE